MGPPARDIREKENAKRKHVAIGPAECCRAGCLESNRGDRFYFCVAEPRQMMTLRTFHPLLKQKDDLYANEVVPKNRAQSSFTVNLRSVLHAKE